MMADAPAVVKYFLRKLSGCKGLTGRSYDRLLRTLMLLILKNDGGSKFLRFATHICTWSCFVL